MSVFVNGRYPDQLEVGCQSDPQLPYFLFSPESSSSYIFCGLEYCDPRPTRFKLSNYPHQLKIPIMIILLTPTLCLWQRYISNSNMTTHLHILYSENIYRQNEYKRMIYLLIFILGKHLSWRIDLLEDIIEHGKNVWIFGILKNQSS